MVVDAVICHWVTVVTPTEAGTGGLGLTIIKLTAYLYADDDLVASTQPERLQRSFDFLTNLFDRFGMRTNKMKTVGMVCQPCPTPGGMSEVAYVQWVAGKGPTFQERQRMQVECPECGVEVKAGSLLTQSSETA